MANAFHKLGTFLANLRYKSRFVSANIIFVSLLSLVSLVAIEVAFNIYNSVFYKQVAETLAISTSEIENELRLVDKLSYDIVTDPDIQGSLAELAAPISVARRRILSADLSNRLWTLIFERGIISINIIDGQGVQYAGGAQIPTGRLDAIVKSAALREGGLTLIPPDQDEQHLVCARQIREIAGLSLKPLGTLIVRFNIADTALRNSLDPANIGSNLVILTPDGKRIFSSAEDLYQFVDHPAAALGDTNYTIKKIRGQSCFIVQSLSDYTHWTYIRIIPYRSIFNRVSTIKRIVITIFILLFLLMNLMNFNVIRALTQPLKKNDSWPDREKLHKDQGSTTDQVKQDGVYLGRNRTILKTLDYIQNHLDDENMTLKWLAEEVLYVNVGYLSRLFVKEMGVKFSQYLLRMRMERARELISQSADDKVCEVAQKIGFGNNPQYFSRVFKKYTGFSPSEYRKQCRGKARG